MKARYVFAGIGAVLALIAALFALQLLGLANFKFFAPKWQDARHEVFKQTRAFNEAVAQDLAKYRLEYLRENDPVAKKALLSVIVHRFAEYNPADVENPDLAAFLRDVVQGEIDE